jgi:hypothetical protein
MMRATITRLIEEGKSEEAKVLLVRRIRQAEILDPRRDDSWGIESDRIGYATLERQGIEAFRAYWQELLRFFTEELEPAWGHLHKGHIYLRLGIAALAGDLKEAYDYFTRGLGEDRIVAESRRKLDPRLDVEEAVRDSPANVTLCTVQLLERWSFATEESRKRFFRELVPLKFDVIWGPQEVDPRRVERALKGILTRDPDPVLRAKGELDRAFDARLPLVTMAGLEVFLRILLIRLLPPSVPLPSLHDLLEQAEAANLFPNVMIRVTLRLAQILTGLFPFATELGVGTSSTARVLQQIAVMLKILVDLALVRWSEERPC